MIESGPVMYEGNGGTEKVGNGDENGAGVKEENGGEVKEEISAPVKEENGKTAEKRPWDIQLSPSAELYVRLMGLPYKADEKAVREWFGELPVVTVTRLADIDHRLSIRGEAYVQLGNAEAVQEALKKNREYLQNRYVEVFAVPDAELQTFLTRIEERRAEENRGYVRLGGLPFDATRQQVEAFFEGLSVVDVIFGKDVGGKPWSGVVKFATREDAERAMDFKGKHMGKRWIDLNLADSDCYAKFKVRQNRPAPGLFDQPMSYMPTAKYPAHPAGPPRGYGYDPYEYNAGGYGGQGYGGGPAPHERPPRGGGPHYAPYEPPAYGRRGPAPVRGDYDSYRGGGYEPGPPAYGSRSYESYGSQPSSGYGGGSQGDGENVGPTKIFMRGLPFRITARQVEDFFAPIVCVDVKFGVRSDGRSSGDGVVVFRTPGEARKALEKDRANIGNRYVELYPTMQMPPPRSNNYYSALEDEGDYGPPPLSGGGYSQPPAAGGGYAGGYSQPPSGGGYGPSAAGGYSQTSAGGGYAPAPTSSNYTPLPTGGGMQSGQPMGRQQQQPPPPPEPVQPPTSQPEYGSYPTTMDQSAVYGYGYGYGGYQWPPQP